MTRSQSRFALTAIAVAAWAMLAASTPAARASVAKDRSQEESASAERAEKPTLVAARALITRARAAHRDERYAEAVRLTDESLALLRRLMVRDTPISLRVAAGELFRSGASLRLAATRKLDIERESSVLVGPLPGDEDEVPEGASPLAEALLDVESGVAPGAEPVVLPGDPLFGADEDATEDPAPSPTEETQETETPSETPDKGEPEKVAAPGPNNDPIAIRLRDNARVDKWLKYYTGRGRSHYERYLTRSGRYEAWMREILRQEGVPVDLVQLVIVESGFNTHAVSRSRAVGQWQFIRGTAHLFGLRMTSTVDERRDPELATRAAARYLKHLYALFQDWDLAIASYNCGEGRTIRTIAKSGVWDYWALRLPREAMDYVPKYMACLALSRDMEGYDLDRVPMDTPLDYDTIHLPGAFDVRPVAGACGISLDSLRVLNPALKKTVTAPRLGVSQLRVPHGRGEEIVSAFTKGNLAIVQVALASDAEVRRHKVRRGETLGGISRRYRVPLGEIAELNHIRPQSTLRIGQTLLIPEREISLAARGSGSSDVEGPTAYSSVKTIRIRHGDTLSGIATRYDTDVHTLRALNNLRPKQAIRAGGVLKVPVR